MNRITVGAVLIALAAWGGGSAGAAAQQDAAAELLRTAGTGWELYAPSEDALERGRQGLDHVITQYEQIFGDPPAKLTFVLHDTNEQAADYARRLSGHQVKLWPNFRVRGASPSGEGGTVSYTDKETIAHEAMHRLLQSRYTRPLPPWLSEGLASFIEPSAGELKRYWSLLEVLAPHVVSVRDLMTMPHPASSAVPTGEVSGTVITMRTSGPGTGVLYAQSMALLEYFAEQEGVRFVGRLSDEIAGGGTLQSALDGAARLPSDLDELDRDFRAWLVAREIPLQTNRER